MASLRIGNWLALIIVLMLSGAPAGARIAVPPVWGAIEPGAERPSVEVRWTRDPTRPSNAGERGGRRVQLAVWYPTEDRRSPGMTLGDLAERLASGGPPGWPGARAQLAVSSEPGLPAGGERFLRELRLASSPASRPLPGRRPLVLIGQGLYYESPVHLALLAEVLASHGYVVATVPLVGSRTTLARLSVDDVESAYRDQAFALSLMRADPRVDPNRIASLGFDLGGIVGLRLAASDPGIRALVSLDSGVAAPFLTERFVRGDLSGMRAAVLHVTRPKAELTARKLPEDLALLRQGSGRRYVARVPGMRHADFAIHGMVEGISPAFWGPTAGQPAARGSEVMALILAFLERWVREGPEMPARFGSTEVEVDAASPAHLSFDEVVAAALRGGVPGVVELESRLGDGSVRGVDDHAVDRLGGELLHRRADPRTALAVARLLERGAPSGRVQLLLGDAAAALGHSSLATEAWARAAKLGVVEAAGRRTAAAR